MLDMSEFISGLVLGAIGLLLNITEVTLLSHQKAKKTKYQNLIRSLSAADICTCLFFLSSYIYRHVIYAVDSKSETSRAIIVVKQELLWFSVSSSLLHVLAISFDRLLAVRFPMKHRFWFTHKKNTKLIIIIWALSFLLILPAIIVYSETERNYLVKQLISSLVLITGFLIILLYAYIIRKTVSKECLFEIITLQSGKKEVVSACSPREKRILLTSVLIVISFFVCSFPFAITYIVTKSKNYTILLLLSNSILNPLIYFFQRYYQDKKDETVRRKTQQEPQKKSPQVKVRTPTPLPEEIVGAEKGMQGCLIADQNKQTDTIDSRKSFSQI